MKQLIKIQLTAILAFALFLASCSKKDSPAPITDTKTLLTGKTWSVIKSGNDDNNNNVIDDAEFRSMPDGQNVYETFLADGTGTQSLLGTINSFTWTLVNQQTIMVTLMGSSNYLHIKILTATEFDFDEFDAANKVLTAGFKFVPK